MVRRKLRPISKKGMGFFCLIYQAPPLSPPRPGRERGGVRVKRFQWVDGHDQVILCVRGQRVEEFRKSPLDTLTLKKGGDG